MAVDHRYSLLPLQGRGWGDGGWRKHEVDGGWREHVYFLLESSSPVGNQALSGGTPASCGSLTIVTSHESHSSQEHHAPPQRKSDSPHIASVTNTLLPTSGT